MSGPEVTVFNQNSAVSGWSNHQQFQGTLQTIFSKKV